VQLTVDSLPWATRFARARPWIAVIVAALIFALIPLVGMQLFLVVPVIGLALSAGAPPDYVADPNRSIAGHEILSSASSR
jgi:hypothetical protein